MTGPGAAETAASFMDAGVSESYERRSIKFRVFVTLSLSAVIDEMHFVARPQSVCLLRPPPS